MRGLLMVKTTILHSCLRKGPAVPRRFKLGAKALCVLRRRADSPNHRNHVWSIPIVGAGLPGLIFAGGGLLG
jgi:hypothetical protein